MHHQWDNNQYLLDTVDMIYDLLGERVRNSLGIWDTTPFLLHKVTHKKYVIGLDPWIGLWCFVPFSTLKVKVPKLEVPSMLSQVWIAQSWNNQWEAVCAHGNLSVAKTYSSKVW